MSGQPVPILLSVALLTLMGCGDEDKSEDTDTTEECVPDGSASDGCDGMDNDCDGNIDEDVEKIRYYPDSDGDGYGYASGGVEACSQPANTVSNNYDCDDGDPSTNPDAQEECDNADNDCDGLIDDADPDVDGTTTYFFDSDGDGYGSADGPTFSLCDAASGFVDNTDDCDDTDDEVSPTGAEVCNDVDDDCDGLIDDDDEDVTGQTTWYFDGDRDGYGISSTSITACEAGSNYAVLAGDCSPGNADVNPGADEVCNDGEDTDCDGDVGDCLPWQDDLSRADATLTVTPLSGSGNRFGSYIATGDLDGDGSQDLVMGEPSGGTYGYGGVYVFGGAKLASLREGTAVAPLTHSLGVIESTSSSSSTNIGFSVATADLDGDGYDDLLASAYYYYAFAYMGPITGDMAVSTSDTLAYGMGYANQISAPPDLLSTGDADGDGVTDVLIGDPGYSGTYSSSGRVFLLTGPVSQGSSISATDADYTIAAPVARAYAGGHVALADLNGDGIDDVTAGAPSGFNSSGTSGYGSLVVNYGGRLSGTDYLYPGYSDAFIGGVYSGGYFGAEYTADGDLDGDGYPDLAIGAPTDATYGGSDYGLVYIFHGPVTGTLDADGADAGLGPDAGGYFGMSVDAIEDQNDDGMDDLLVGQLLHSASSASYAGAVFYFADKVSGVGTASDATATIEGSSSSEYFGGRVRGGGDWNEDGLIDFVTTDYNGKEAEIWLNSGGW